jgi:hypothetical protein
MGVCHSREDVENKADAGVHVEPVVVAIPVDVLSIDELEDEIGLT